MDFRQIEAFVYVYRLRNFSRAGEVLYLTQPTISSHINALERQLGVKLFDRSSRDVIPTGAGDIFYQHAVALLDARSCAVSSLSEYNNKIEGRLEIAASTIPSQYLLPRLMKGFRALYPHIRFYLHQCDSREVMGEIQEKRFEIGIAGARMEEDKLDFRFLTVDRLVLITAKGDTVNKGSTSSLPLKDLGEKNFIFREPGSGTRQEFETALKKKGIYPESLRVAAEMNSTEAIKHAVHQGLGVSVVSFLSVEDYLDLGLIDAYSIEGLDLDRAFYLVSHRNRPLSPPAAAFKKYILTFYQK